MIKPRLLDLFCGAGGAGMGYHRAGFEVVGEDIETQPHYPFEFHQADALEVLDLLLAGGIWEGYVLDDFSAIHASPPCQGYSRMRHLPWLKGNVYPLLIAPTKERLQAWGGVWVIENVEDAPLARSSELFGAHGVLLCGTMFDLPIYRHRPFESSVPLVQLEHRRHTKVIAPGRLIKDRARVTTWQRNGGIGGHGGGVQAKREAMGIDWMPGNALSQAIPPAYTQYIGEQLLQHLSVSVAPTTTPPPSSGSPR